VNRKLLTENVRLSKLLGQKQETDREERQNKEQAEASIYTVIKLATVEDIRKQVGESGFELVDHEACRRFWLNKQTPFVDFKRQVAAELGVPMEQQRYWTWAMRQNQTIRPHRVLLPEDEAQTVSQVQLESPLFKCAPVAFNFMLFLEVVSDPEAVVSVATSAATRARSGGRACGGLLAPSIVPVSHILLFFKLYDPLAETLRFIGHLLLDQESCMLDNKHAVLKLAAGSLCGAEEMALYEEIFNQPTIYCENMKWDASLKDVSQLQNGDIICLQPEILQSKTYKGEVRFETVQRYLEDIRYIQQRQREISNRRYG
jgi:ubiquitin carboxyl-terminal hydrolase 7